VSKTTVEFEYGIGEQVKIMAIEMLGRVQSLRIDIDGKTYWVVYWNDGQRHAEWLNEWEIAKA